MQQAQSMNQKNVLMVQGLSFNNCSTPFSQENSTEVFQEIEEALKYNAEQRQPTPV